MLLGKLLEVKNTVMVSRVPVHVHTHWIVYIKYLQFCVYQWYLNKADLIF